MSEARPSRILIIGGGAIGLSVAYHLAGRQAGEIVLVERNTLTAGTSWHAAGIVGPLRSTLNMSLLAMEAGRVFPRLEAETGLTTGYAATGGYWLARVPERMDELRRIAALGRHVGLTPRVLSGDEVSRELPDLNLEGLSGALAVAEDAQVNPVDLCMAYAKAARRGGVSIRENLAVSEILMSSDASRRVSGVRLADGATLEADAVVLCAGAWSRTLARTAGVELPLQAVEHMYIVTEPIDGLAEPFPVLRDLDRGLYVKGDAGKLVIGGFEPDAKCWDADGPNGTVPFLELPEDWEQFGPFMEASLDLVPMLETAGIRHFMNGPESFTVDSKPLIGPAPGVDGLYVAAGMNSVGVMSSAGIGKAMASWITEGAPPFDLWEVDVARADPRAGADEHMAERMRESVADVFSMHWPYKMPKSGRGLRKSVLHDRWAARGAVFGLTAGWERGVWYAANEAERVLPYAVGRQAWEPVAAREARNMADGAALIDLTPFTKIDVSGPAALDCLNGALCGNADIPVGRMLYTAVLNQGGGIEVDLTVQRLGEDVFRLVSGAATRRRDLDRIRRLSEGRDVIARDVTEDYAVIGVMGPESRNILQSLSSSDWMDFPFGDCRTMDVAGVSVVAARVSFVGELGWELTIGADGAGHVFDAVSGAGAGVLGHYALDGCRLEKGFKHWGHDLGPQTTPLESGLGFMVDPGKPHFTGRDAVLAQKRDGVAQRLVLFSLPPEPLMLHDEPIIRDGRVVGLTTSGGMGPRTGLNLAFGLVSVERGETRAETHAAEYAVDVAGSTYPATALVRPPYDPDGERMKS